MDETTVLIEQLQNGDKDARKVLIEKNLGLVHHIVKRFLGRGVDAEDLFQIGTIGLMKAIDKFDLSFQVKFSIFFCHGNLSFFYGEGNKKALCIHAEDENIPVVPPQFTAQKDGLSGPNRPQRVTGRTRLCLLRGFRQSRSERYSDIAFPLPCTNRQLSEGWFAETYLVSSSR